MKIEERLFLKSGPTGSVAVGPLGTWCIWKEVLRKKSKGVQLLGEGVGLLGWVIEYRFDL